MLYNHFNCKLKHVVHNICFIDYNIVYEYVSLIYRHNKCIIVGNRKIKTNIHYIYIIRKKNELQSSFFIDKLNQYRDNID